MVCNSDNGIRKIYTDEVVEGDLMVSTLYVAHNMQSHAYHLLPYSTVKPIWVVTDIYSWFYHGNQLDNIFKVEFYYNEKRQVDDDYTLLSAKTFVNGLKYFRTDWYDQSSKKFTYSTIELGASNNPEYKKYEWFDYKPKFMYKDEEYKGVLLGNKFLDNVISNAMLINLELREVSKTKTLGI